VRRSEEQTTTTSKFKKTKISPQRVATITLATKKIAEITVSWEPDAARNILELAKQREQEGEADQPLLVGVVGIPGSGEYRRE